MIAAADTLRKQVLVVEVLRQVGIPRAAVVLKVRTGK